MDKMKKVGKYGSWLIVSALLLYVQMANAQKTLGIGTDKPNPRAILELKVEDPSVYSQGLLLPRLNNLQRANLAGNLTAADAGMSVYDTSDKTFYTWDGAQWNSSSTLLTSILGINGITVTQTGNAFTISGANASQWISTVGGIFYTTSVGINGIAPTTGTGLNIKSFGLSTKPIRVENSAGTFPLFEIDEGSGGNGNLLLYNSTGTLLNQISSTNPTFFNGGASVGIGTSSPNQKLTVQGNSSVTGIGYFSSIAGLALNGASAGSVVTVDGTGKLGFGALASSTPSQWTTSGTNIYYQGSNANNGFVGIGTSTPTVLFQINYVPSTGFDLVGSQLTYNFSNATGNLKGLKIDFTSTPSSSSSEASKGIELNSNNSFTNTDGDAYGLNVISNSSGNGANAFVVGVLNDVRGNLTGAGSTKLGYYTFVQNAATTNIGIRAHATGALNNYAAIFDEGLVGIGTLNPNKDLTVVGETSVTGIAYLGTIIGNNLAGASGSVVTVDGVGRMGIGTVASSTQYLTINGNNLQPIDNYGFNLSLSGAYRINGTQIIGTSNIPTAVNNVFLGGAGNTSITGSNNLFFGTSTGIGISTGSNNISLGNNAGSVNNYSDNIYIGLNTGRANQNNNNVMIGSNAGSSSTSAMSNTFIGDQAGDQNFIGDFNIAIGSTANFGSGNLSNAMALGSGAIINSSDAVSIGNNITGLGINTGSPTAMLDVNGGARIRALSVTGSVLTVDGLGNVGMGSIAASVNYFTISGNNIRTLNNSNNIQLASTSGAYLIGSNTALRMDDNNSIFMGNGAGSNTITGANNFFAGSLAGGSTSSGGNNIFMGSSAGEGNTTGSSNSFIGLEAGQSNSTGTNNIFIGESSGNLNQTGNYNIAIGATASFASSDLTNAIAIGKTTVATGSNQMVLGANAGSANALTAVGISTNTPTAMLDVNGGARIRALSVTGSVLTVDGLGNVGMGTIATTPNYWTLSGNNLQPLTNNGINLTTITSSYNIQGQKAFSGSPAFRAYYIGSAGNQSNSGVDNFFVGTLAGFANNTGSNNNFFGFNSGQVNNNGGSNNFMGFQSGRNNIDGSNNNFFGANAGRGNTNGGWNQFIGRWAGGTNTTGDYNIALGAFSDMGSSGLTNAIAIGAYATVGGSNMMMLGGLGPFALNVGIGTSVPGAKLDVVGSVRFQNLSVSGSVLTVDGLGNVGMGTIAAGTPSQWISPSINQIYTNSFVGIGVSDPTEALEIAGNIIFSGAGGREIIGNGSTNTPFSIYQNSATSNGSYIIMYGNTENPTEGVVNIVANSQTISNPRSGAIIFSDYNGSTTDNNLIINQSGLVSVPGVGQFGTIIGTNLAGASGSVVTVDGAGKLGIGTMASSTQYLTLVGANIQPIDNNQNINISTTTAYRIGGSTVLRKYSANNSLMLGNNAGSAANTGDHNLFYGNNAGAANTTGLNNVFLGNNAGLNNTTGTSNIFLGLNAGNANTTGQRNLFLGEGAAANNTTGNNNVAIGYLAGGGSPGASPGDNNISIGSEAGSKINGGSNNNMFGLGAGLQNTTGFNNNFMGSQAAQQNTTGSDNNFFGFQAGRANNTGSFNNIIGHQGGNPGVNAGFHNNFFGTQAGLGSNSTLGNNFFGYRAGVGNVTGAYNIAIGYSTGMASGALNNAIAIGSFTTATGSNQIVLGSNITSLGINTNTPTAMLDVNGGARIRNLSVAGTIISDALGNLSVSTLAGGSSQWISASANQIYTNSFVGIGTSTPIASLHIVSPNTIAGIFDGANTNAATPILISVRNTTVGGSAGFYMSTDNNNSNAVIGVSPGEMFFRSIEHSSNVLAYATSNRRLNLFESISNSGSMVVNATAVGIGVNTFTGREALRIGSYNGTKGLVMPYVTTAQMVTLSVSGLTAADQGMFFWDTDRKDVAIWDGTKFDSRGDGNNNNGYGDYVWNIFGGNSIGGTNMSVSGYGAIGTRDAYGLVLRTNDVNRIVISTVGGVGIATNNPKATLQVNGDIGLGDGTNAGNKPMVIWLFNLTGTVLEEGSIVVASDLVNNSITITTTPQDNAVAGVLYEQCAIGANCKVAIAGVVNVKVTPGGITRAQHCVTSSTDKIASSVPIPNAGASIGIFLEDDSDSNGLARVLLR